MGFLTLTEAITLVFPQQFEPEISSKNDLGVSSKNGQSCVGPNQEVDFCPK
jgi:hypothetical protein